MTSRSAVLAGVVAAGLVAVPVAAAATSHGTTYRPPTSSSAKHTNAGHSHDKLAGPRRATQRTLTAAARQLSALQSTAAAAALSDDNRAELDAALQAATAALTADLGAVPHAASVPALNGLKQAGQVTVSVARLQLRAVVRADGVADRLGVDQTLLDGLQQSSALTAPQQSELDDAQQQLTRAAADLQDVSATVDNLTPVASRKGLATATATVARDLDDASAALQAAETTLGTVQ